MGDQTAGGKMTNDQANAANVLESTLDLVKQILLKHETLVISEMRRVVEAKNHELKLIYAERDKAISDMEDLRRMCDEQMERANVWRDRAKTAEGERGYMPFCGPKVEVAEPGCGGDWTDEGWHCRCDALYPRYCKGA